jgi:hypothetical protein
LPLPDPGRALGGRHHLAPTNSTKKFRFPTEEVLSVFVQWTSARGSYQLRLQLLDMEGDIRWQERIPVSFDMPDPLHTYAVLLQDMHLLIPEPGKYDLLLLANEEEVVRDVFWAHQVEPPAP